MPLRLAFSDMWTNFDPHHNFITALFKILVDGDFKITTPAECNTLIYSVFGNEHQNYKDKFRIHFTGENTRPPLADAHFCVSFDFNARNHGNSSSTNYRLPLWWWFINWGGFELPAEAQERWYWPIPFSYLDRQNEFTIVPKTKFCAAIFRKTAKHRLETLAAFEKSYKSIDSYGRSDALPCGESIYDKLQVLSQYKFCMCYENSSYPGYVTEKMLHAKVAGTVPIYWGNRTFAMDFNPQCCVFFDGDYDKLVAEVRRLDEDDAAYTAMTSQPLFSKLPDINMGAWVFYDIFRRRFDLAAHT